MTSKMSTPCSCSWHFGFFLACLKRNIPGRSRQKNLQLPMDSEAKFQLQPSSSVEALELLLGAGLDRVQELTSCLEQTHRTRGPLLKIVAWIRDPSHDRQRNKATTSWRRVASLKVRCWPDERTVEYPYARPIITVSESTTKTLKSVFEKPLLDCRYTKCMIFLM